MDIERHTTPEVVLKELTGRLARYRMESGFTQAELSAKAGVGKRTLERIEKGCDTQVTTLIRLLLALDLTDRLEQLVPKPQKSPMALLAGKSELTRKRVRHKSDEKSERTWKWEDER